MPPKILVDTGRKFGDLTILLESNVRNRHRYFQVQCVCGVVKEVRLDSLTRGQIVSCGCGVARRSTTHNMSQSTEFKIWQGMNQRCHNENDKSYYRYGGRGISVCYQWRNSFEQFYLDMGKRPEEYQIERINNQSDYCPSNCEWASTGQQGQNKRSSYLWYYQGKLYESKEEIASLLGLHPTTVASRCENINQPDFIKRRKYAM